MKGKTTRKGKAYGALPHISDRVNNKQQYTKFLSSIRGEMYVPTDAATVARPLLPLFPPSSQSTVEDLKAFYQSSPRNGTP